MSGSKRLYELHYLQAALDRTFCRGAAYGKGVWKVAAVSIPGQAARDRGSLSSDGL